MSWRNTKFFGKKQKYYNDLYSKQQAFKSILHFQFLF